MAIDSPTRRRQSTQQALVHFVLGADPEIRAHRWRILQWKAGIFGILVSVILLGAQLGGVAVAAALAEGIFQVGLFRLFKIPTPWFAKRKADSHPRAPWRDDLVVFSGFIALMALLGILLFVVLRLPNGVVGLFALLFCLQSIVAPLIVVMCIKWGLPAQDEKPNVNTTRPKNMITDLERQPKQIVAALIVGTLILSGVVQGEEPKAANDRLQASLNGKFKTLLKEINVPQDEENYGKFHDWGYWSGKSWAKHNNLPAGYWVYVAPSWYIWKADPKTGSGSGGLPIVQKTADRPAIVVRSVAEAAKLPPGVESLRVVMWRRHDRWSPHCVTLRMCDD